jgi:predicted dehydrogenase
MRALNRRQFTQLSALTFAAASTRLLGQPSSGRPLGYAAVGLGSISDIFMRACQTSSKAKITGLVTGEPDDKGRRYGALYGVPMSSVYNYETFDQIANNKEIDAVYIGLPNSMHCEYTVRAAAAGKHVLCEKPMAISSAECQTMIDACRKANVQLMIAYRIQYEPLWKQALALLRGGAIGEIESFEGSFFNQQPAGAWRLDRKLSGGGPILDLGIYPLNAIRHIAGQEPTSFTAVTSTRDHSGRFAQVEQSMEWTMKFPSGIIASCSCSYGASAPGVFRINGSAGSMRFEPAFNYDGIHLYGQTTKTPEGAPPSHLDILSPGKAPYQFTIEADYFADCVRNNTVPLSGGEEGWKDLLAIEAIYRAAGSPIA